MKKILIIGDSISIGYRKYVEYAYRGIAEVAFPNENCRFTTYIVRNLCDWIPKLEMNDADVVHWNAGLWDCLRLADGEPLVSPEEYRKNVGRIGRLISRFCPNAKTVFAYSTPVVESGYKGINHRFNADIENYNGIASEALKPFGTVVNDLYSVMKAVPEEYHSDMTHFYTRGGTEIITNAVISAIENVSGEKAAKLDYDAVYGGGCDNVIGY